MHSVGRPASSYDCFEGLTYICAGTIPEIAEHVGLKEATVKSYAAGPGGHRYQLYRWPRRERDVTDMRRMGIREFREA